MCIRDSSREVRPFKNKEMVIGDTTAVVHEYHTNGIVYSDFCFDMSELPEELIPYATLLSEIYRYVDTEHFSYNDLATAVSYTHLSNISFGLPERPYVNSAFAAMAIASGLTMAIANPSNQLLMGISFASDLLRNKEGSDIAYIEQIQRMAPLKEAAMAKAAQSAGNNGIKKTEQTDNKSTAKEADKKKNPVFEAVLKGNKDGIVDFVKEELSQGTKPGEILDGLLIPAINEVGTLFDKQIYFLPQLISSANTMERCV